MITKKCTGLCGLDLPLECFAKSKLGKYGVRADCKSCFNKKHTSEKRKEKDKQYWMDNKDKLTIKKRNWQENNKEKCQAYCKKYEEDHKEEIKIRKKQYYTDNKEKINTRERNYAKTDPQFKIKKNLRHRLNNALKGNYKTGSAVKDLGCSVGELKLHLEAKFYPRPITNEPMTWDNHNLHGWHIDHIQPLSSFDLTDREQLLKACHYSNLQPLWSEENLAKSNKI